MSINCNNISYYCDIDYDQDLRQYRHSGFNINSVEIPYILPVTMQESEIHIEIPNALASLLLELGNQKIENPISAKLNITYQDIAGKSYRDTFVVNFNFDRSEENDGIIFCQYKVRCKAE